MGDCSHVTKGVSTLGGSRLLTFRPHKFISASLNRRCGTTEATCSRSTRDWRGDPGRSSRGGRECARLASGCAGFASQSDICLHHPSGRLRAFLHGGLWAFCT